MLKVVAPRIFQDFLAELNIRGRRTVTLLAEREVELTEEAREFLEAVDEDETIFLHRRLIRPTEERGDDQQVPAETGVPCPRPAVQRPADPAATAPTQPEPARLTSGIRINKLNFILFDVRPAVRLPRQSGLHGSAERRHLSSRRL